MKRSIVDLLHLIVHGTEPPTDVEWAGYLTALEQQGPGLVELIVTAGAGPTRSQRTLLRSFLAERRLPVAILVDGSTLTRLKIDFWGRVTRRWEVRVFPASELVEALAFLGVPVNRELRVKDEIARLRQEGRLEDCYAELLAEHPQAKHCAPCGTVGVGACACECWGCIVAVALLLQARRYITGSAEAGEQIELGEALRQIEAGLTMPKDAGERIHRNVLAYLKRRAAR
jgi:hypothetical protein